MNNLKLDTLPEKYSTFNVEDNNQKQNMIFELKTDSQWERKKVYILTGLAVAAGLGIAGTALMASQVVGALFVHVVNLEAIWGWYTIVSLGTENLLYAGSTGLMLGGMAAGAFMYHTAVQAYQAAQSYWQTADRYENLAIQLGLQK